MSVSGQTHLFRPDLFAGRTAIISAAGNGIGRATALMLARHGCSVVVADMDGCSISSLVEEITLAGGAALAVECDVTDVAARQRLFDRWAAWRSELDFLVHAVGMGYRGPLAAMDIETWRKMFAVNLDSAVCMAQLAYPHLARSPVASLVNIGSGVARGAYPNGGGYGPSKAALVNLGYQLAMEWASDRIRVNTINPGVTRTPRMAGILTPEAESKIVDHTPLGRLVEAAEVAATVCFLLSEAASAVTGQAWDVDCGYSQSLVSAP